MLNTWKSDGWIGQRNEGDGDCHICNPLGTQCSDADRLLLSDWKQRGEDYRHIKRYQKTERKGR